MGDHIKTFVEECLGFDYIGNVTKYLDGDSATWTDRGGDRIRFEWHGSHGNRLQYTEGNKASFIRPNTRYYVKSIRIERKRNRTYGTYSLLTYKKLGGPPRITNVNDPVLFHKIIKIARACDIEVIGTPPPLNRRRLGSVQRLLNEEKRA